MANVRGLPKTTMHRLVLTSAFPQKGDKLNGYNLSFAMAMDRMTKADIEAGKGQTAPMLAYNKYTDKTTGEEKTSHTMAYSKQQYDAIMAAANTKGDKPVIEAQVFPKNGGLFVNTKNLATPKYKFNDEKHKANIELAREISAKAKDAKENQAEAEAQAQAQAEQQGPEIG